MALHTQPQVLDEDEIEAAMRALDVARGALVAAQKDSYDDFRVTLLGGEAVLRSKGIPYKGLLGAACNFLAKDFCTRRHVPQSAQCDW